MVLFKRSVIFIYNNKQYTKTPVHHEVYFKCSINWLYSQIRYTYNIYYLHLVEYELRPFSPSHRLFLSPGMWMAYPDLLPVNVGLYLLQGFLLGFGALYMESPWVSIVCFIGIIWAVWNHGIGILYYAHVSDC